MKPEISILITSYKNPALLKLCINSIKKNINEKVSYEIVVADSDTQEETYDLMREHFSGVIFLPNKKNVGFGKLVNPMIKVAKGRFLFILNADIIIKDNAINSLIEFLKKNKDVGIVAPKLINFDGSVQQSCFGFYSPLTVLYRRTFLGKFSFAKKHLERFLFTEEQRSSKLIEADWVMGSAMMTSAEAVDKVGLFDDKKFFLYFEDVDWCWRFWKMGYKVVYIPWIKVFHYHGKASESKNVIKSLFFNKYARMHISSGIKFFLKHFWERNPHVKNIKTEDHGTG